MLRITAVFSCVLMSIPFISGAASAATPTNVQYSSFTSSLIEASWVLDSPGQIPFYALSTVSNFATTLSSEAGAPGQENVFINGLAKNTTYYFKVKVSTEASYSSPINSATLAEPPGTAPTVVLSSTQIQVTWTHDGNPTDTTYSGEMASDLAFTNILVEDLPFLPGTTLTATDLDTNTTYYFRVRAENRQGLRTAYTVLPAAITNSSPPVSIAPTNVFGRRLTANWVTDQKPATQYLAQASTASNFTGSADFDTGWVGALASREFAPLTLNTQYFTRVKSRGLDHVESVFINLPSTTTQSFLETPPPININDSTSSPTTLSFTWDMQNSNEAPLLVLGDGGDFSSIFSSFTHVVNQSSHQFTGLSVNATYSFMVKVSTANDFFYSNFITTVTPTIPVTPGPTTILSSTIVNVSWTPNGNPGGTRYIVNVYDDNTYTNLLDGTDFLTGLNEDLPGLTPGTSFYFRVLAFNHGGDASQPSVLTEAMTHPAPPVAAQVEQVLDTELRTNWISNNPGGTRFQVQLSTATDFTGSLDQDSGFSIDNTSFTFTGLSVATTYYTQVRARNEAGVDSAFVSLPSTTTLSFPSALPPTNILLSTVTSSSIDVSWNLLSPGQTPLYAMSVSSDFATTVASITGTIGLEKDTILTLGANTTYYFKIKVSTVNDFFFSAIYATATRAVPATPAASVAISTEEVQVNWTHGLNPSDTLYAGEISENVGFSPVLNGTDLETGTSINVPGLAPNTSYFFRVFAGNRYEILTASVALPTIATLAEPATGPFFVDVFDASLQLHWDTQSNTTGTQYLAELSTAADFTGSADVNSTFLANRSSFSFTSLTQETTYYSRVRARNFASIETAVTTVISTYTLSVEPILPPSNIRASAISTGSLRMDWDLGSPGEAPLYAVSTDPGFGTTISSETGTVGQTTKSESALSPNTTHFFRIKVSTANDIFYSSTFATATLAQVPISSPTLVLSSTSIEARWGVDQNPVGTQYSGDLSATDNFLSLLAQSEFDTDAAIPIGGLDANTTYYLRVRGRNFNGIQTSTVALPAAVTFAARPTAQFPSVVLDTVLTTHWDPGDNPPGTDYSVEIASDAAFTLDFQASPFQTNTSSFTFTTLSLDTTYYSRVRARNHAGIPGQYASLPSTRTLAFEAVLPPSNIQVATITPTELGYSWSLLSPAESPLYVFGEDAGFAVTVASETGGVNQSSHVVTGLSINTSYYFHIKVATAPDYFYSTILTTATLAAVPVAQPTVVLSSGDIQVDWTANGNPSGTQYFAELALDTNFGSIVQTSDWTSSSDFIGVGLSPNTTFYSRVRARNYSNVLTSAVSLQTVCTLADLAAASIPPSPSAVSLGLNWTVGGNPAGTEFLAEVDDDPGFGSLDASGWLAGTTTTFLDLLPNTTYYTRVRVRNCAKTETVNTNLENTATLAALPTVLPASGVTISTIAANWGLNGNPGSTEFYSEIASDSIFTIGYASTPYAAVVSSTYTGLTPNTTYYFRVTGRNVAGTESSPASLSDQATDAVPPGALPHTLVSNNQVSVAWDVLTNPAGTLFQTERSTDANFNGILTASPFTTDAFYTFSSLAGNTTYYFRVKARSHNGNDTAYTVLSATLTIPSPPISANPQNVYGSRLRTHWGTSDNGPGTEYYVELSTATDYTGSLDQNSGFAADLSSYTFEGLQLDTTYYTRAKARSFVQEESGFTLLPTTVTLNFFETLPPTAVGVDTVTLNSLDAFWTLENPTMAAHYKLSTVENFSSIFSSETLAVNASSITLSALASNTTYYFKIKISTANDIFFSDVISTATAALDPGPLTPVTLSSSDISIYWDHGGNPNGTEFLAEQATNSGFSAGLTNGGWTTLNGSTFTALSPNTTYYNRVRARGHNGTTKDPIVLSSTMTAAEPPSSGASTILSSAGVFVSFSTGTNPGSTEFQIDISSDAGFINIAGTAGWGTIRESTFTGLVPDTAYYSRARGRNARGANTAYTVIPTTRTLAEPPGAVSPGPVYGHLLTINWSGGNNPAATVYFAEISTASDFSGSADQNTNYIAALTYEFGSLQLNTTYYSRVKARNNDNIETPYTALATTRTLSFEATLPPISIQYTTASPTSLDISWSLRVGFQTPFYALSTAADFATTVSSQIGIPGQESVSIPGLAVNTTHYFKVKVSTAQDLFYSVPIATATEAVEPAAGSVVSLSSSDLQMGWGAGGNPAGTEFLAEAATNSGFSAGLASGSWTTGFSSTFTALAVNTTYYLRVRARNHYGHPTKNNLAAETATRAEPPVPGTETSVTSAAFAANWGAAGNPAGTEFLVERATDAAFGGTLVDSGWTTAVASTFSALTPNTTHYLRVRARNYAGIETANVSLPSVITAAQPPGGGTFSNVFDVLLSIDWTLGANPAGTEFFTELSSAADFTGSGNQDTGWVADLSSTTFGGLSLGATYYLRSKARNAEFVESTFTILGSTSTLPFTATLPPAQIVFTTATETTLETTWVLDNGTQSPLYALSAVDNFATTVSSLTGNVGQSSATFNALSINTTYWFKIKVSTAIDLFYSSPISTATLAAVPVSSPSVVESSVSLAAHWLLGGNPAGTEFLAEAALDSAFSSGLSSNAWTSNLISTFPALSENTTYYLRVGARNWSGIITATVSLPTNATNAAVPQTGTPVILSSNDARGEWTSGGNPAGTLYQASVSTESSFVPFSTAAWTTLTNSTFTGLSVNTTYYWRVQAISHNDSLTSFVSLTTVPTHADVPVAGAPVALSSNSIRPEWTRGNNPTGTEFLTELATDAAFTANTATGSWSALTNSTFSSLTPNTTYYTRVRARSHGGVETSTIGLTAIPTEASIPASLAPVVLSTGDIAASWTVNSNPAGTEFRAQISTDSNITLGVLSSGWITGTASTFTALLPNATYYARVQARSHAGVLTSTDAVRVDVTLAQDPVSTDPVVLSSSDISVRWDVDSNPANTEFFTQLALDSGFSSGLTDNGWQTGSASTFTSLSPNTSYYLRVKARNQASVETGYTTLPTTMTFSEPPTSAPLTRVFGSRLTSHWGTASNPLGTEFSAEVSTATDFTGSDDQASSYSTISSHTFIGLSLNTVYYSRVRARNLRGVPSNYTTLPTTTTLASETLPPGGIVFDTATATTLDASWVLDNPTQSPFYALSVSSAFAAPISSVTGAVAQSSASIGGLTPNTTYWFTIKVSTALDIFYSIPLATATHAAEPTAGASAAISESSLLAAWNANGNPAGTEYYAERALDAAFTLGAANSGWITTTSSLFSPLSANTTHYLRVKARNHQRIETSTVTLGTVVTHAQSPSAAASVGISSSDIHVSWSTGTNPTGTEFFVEISTHVSFLTLADSAGWTDFKESTFTGRTPNTLHYSRVKSRNALAVETTFTAIPSTWTFAEPPTASPFTDVLGNAISAHWGTALNPTGTEFQVELSTGTNFTGTSDQNSGWGAISSHTFAGLALNTTYYARVQARNGDNHPTAFTSLGSTLTLVTESALPPTNIEFTTASPASLDVSWNLLSPAEAPLYALSLFPDFITTVSSQTGSVGQESVSLTGLTANTTYYFKVKVSTAQDFFYSAVYTTATQASLPGAPLGVAVSSTDLQLNWNANGNPAATLFLAEAALDSGFTLSLASGPYAAGTSSIFNGLSVNTTYFLRVRGRNHYNHLTLTTAAASIATLAEPPGAGAVSIFATSTTVNWSSGSNPAGTEFLAQASTDAAFGGAFTQSGWITGSSETFTTLTPNTTYYLRVKGRNLAGSETTATSLGSAHTLAQDPGAIDPERKFATLMTTKWSTQSNPPNTEFFVVLSTASDYTGSSDQSSIWVTNSSQTFSGLTIGTTYYSRVKARNGLGVETAFVTLPTTVTLLSETLPPGGIVFDTATASTLDASWVLDNPTQTPFYALSVSSNFAATVSSTIGSVAQSSASIGGLSLNTTYWFKIKVSTAIDLFYSIPLATPTLAGVAASSPSVVLSSSRIEAHWLINGNPSGTQFLPEAALDAAYTLGVASGTWQTALISTFSSLSPNSTHYLRVRARNWSGIETSTIALPETVSYAAIPSTTGAAILSTGSLAAYWTANSNPADTQFLAETSTMASFSSIVSSGAWSAVYASTFTDLAPNTTHYVRVRARNRLNIETANLEFSSNATRARDPISGTPVTLSSADVRIVWDADGNPASTEFFSQLSLDAAFTTGLASAGWTTGTTSTLTALTPNTSYYLRVKARSHSGLETSFVTLPTTMTLSQAPAALEPDRVFATRITPQWDVLNNPAGTEFLAQLSTASDFSGTLQPSGWTINSSHTFTGLTSGSTYYSRVQARNLRGVESAFTTLPSTVTLTGEALPPSGIAFDTAAPTELHASWTLDNASQSPFYVLGISSTFAAPVSSATGAVAQSSAAIGGLSPNTTYWFRIKVSTASDLFYSVPIATMTLASAPIAGTPVTVSSVSLQLVWTANSNPSGTEFLPEAALDAAYTMGVVSGSWTTALTQDLESLSSNATYYLRVRARNGFKIETSTTALAPTATNAAPPVSAAASLHSTTTLRVNWTSNGNAAPTSYIAEISTSAVFATLTASSNTLEIFADFSSLETSRLYYSRVRAVGNGGTDSANTSLPNAVTLATAPTAGSIIAVLGQSVVMDWDANGNRVGTEFRVENSTDSLFGGTITQSPWVTISSHTFSALLAETTYYFRVKARNPENVETNFQVLPSTLTLTPPNMPTAVSHTDVGISSLSFAWVHGETGITPLYALSTEENFATTVSSQTGSADQLTLTVSGLTANTTYYFKVKFSTASDDGFSFPIATATFANPPTSLAQTAITTDSVSASWNSSGNGAGTLYVWELDDDFLFGSVDASSTTFGTSATLNSLDPNTRYFGRVRAVNHQGLSSANSGLSAFATLANAPSLTSPSFVTVTFTSVTVQWSGLPVSPTSSSATGYVVEASTASDFSGTLSSSSILSAASRLGLNGLTGSTSYFFRVGTLNPDLTPNYLSLGSTLTLTAATAGQVIMNSEAYTVTLNPSDPEIVSITVDIPAGTLPDGTTVTINTGVSFILPPPQSNQLTLSPLGGVGIDIDTGGVQPNGPVEIILVYDPAQIPAGKKPSSLIMARYDVVNAQWTLLPTTVDTGASRVSGTTDHLSLFAPFFGVAASVLDSVQVFPVPWEPGANTVFDAAVLTFSNLPEGADVQIYSIHGEALRKMTAPASGVVQWDGRNGSGYRVASGTYVVLFKSNGAHATRRVVVIR